MKDNKAEELWDWCLTEVMKLENGKDVWEQINKVKKYSEEQQRFKVTEEIKSKLPKEKLPVIEGGIGKSI